MILRPVRRLSEHEADLWAAFLDAYLSSAHRSEVDVFLRALVGAPRP